MTGRVNIEVVRSILAARAEVEARPERVMRRIAVRELEEVADRWQDEASASALDGNPFRAHHIERCAEGLRDIAVRVFNGAPYVKPKPIENVERPTVAETLGLIL